MRYVESARRYDMAERDHFISLEMAAVGIETVDGLGRAKVEARLRTLTDEIAQGLAQLGNKVSLPDPRLRAPHIMSVGFPGGMPADLIAAARSRQGLCRARGIGRLRISPHVYNDSHDVGALVAALAKALD